MERWIGVTRLTKKPILPPLATQVQAQHGKYARNETPENTSIYTRTHEHTSTRKYGHRDTPRKRRGNIQLLDGGAGIICPISPPAGALRDDCNFGGALALALCQTTARTAASVANDTEKPTFDHFEQRDFTCLPCITKDRLVVACSTPIPFRPHVLQPLRGLRSSPTTPSAPCPYAESAVI